MAQPNATIVFAVCELLGNHRGVPLLWPTHPWKPLQEACKGWPTPNLAQREDYFARAGFTQYARAYGEGLAM